MTAARDLFADETYFLSATNPTATADQRYLEALALDVVKDPAIVDARAQALTRFKILAGWSTLPEEALEERSRSPRSGNGSSPSGTRPSRSATLSRQF